MTELINAGKTDEAATVLGLSRSFWSSCLTSLHLWKILTYCSLGNVGAGIHGKNCTKPYISTNTS